MVWFLFKTGLRELNDFAIVCRYKSLADWTVFTQGDPYAHLYTRPLPEAMTSSRNRATMVMQTEGKKGWFWYIPLHDDVLSVGVVAPYDYLFTGRASKDLETIYFEEVAKCPGVRPRIAAAERSGPFRAAKEYSYRSREVAGDGWVLVGDAFGNYFGIELSRQS